MSSTSKSKSLVRLSRLLSYAGCIRPRADESELVGEKGFQRHVYCNEPHHHFRRVANLYFLLCAILALTPLTPYAPYSLIAPLVLVVGVSMIKEAIEDWRRYLALPRCSSSPSTLLVNPPHPSPPLLSSPPSPPILSPTHPSFPPSPPPCLPPHPSLSPVPFPFPVRQDDEVNKRKVLRHVGEGRFEPCEWKAVRVGDVVKVLKDEFFPADLLMLASSYPDGVCYVETMNLDGETNLKLRKALERTLPLEDPEALAKFTAEIKCEDPNPSLYTFVGNLEWDGEATSLTAAQVLLRDSKLRNTAWVVGVVIFTGHDSKVMMNSTAAPSKRSSIERRMDKIIYFLFACLLLMAIVGSIIFGVRTKNQMPSWWYLAPTDTNAYYDPAKPAASSVLQCLTAIILYGYLIPISLYVSIEIVKIFQAWFISADRGMYFAETDMPARARTSNLNEELGQVDTVLSDKTGTLTCNQMDFLKCSIAGVAYGRGITEVERATARRLGRYLSELEDYDEEEERAAAEAAASGTAKPGVKGFALRDNRLLDGAWLREPHREEIRAFLRVLAVCHTVIPEVDEASGQVEYEAESPDEAAFVEAARQMGVAFFKRTQTTVWVREPDETGQSTVDREYTILALIEFNSTRKRMSVIVRDPSNRILLMTKGADSVIYERLAPTGRQHLEATRATLHRYGEAGLRTLALAYRELSEEECGEWLERYEGARRSLSAEREALVDAAAEEIEQGLTLLGATAVEDKLQQGVPEAIDRLAQTGIKIWVLTGDKLETAINIGFACSLLRDDMKQIVVSLDSPDIRKLEDTGDKEKLAAVSIDSSTGKLKDTGDKEKLAGVSIVARGVVCAVLQWSHIALEDTGGKEKPAAVSIVALGAVRCGVVWCCMARVCRSDHITLEDTGDKEKKRAAAHARSGGVEGQGGAPAARRLPARTPYLLPHPFTSPLPFSPPSPVHNDTPPSPPPLPQVCRDRVKRLLLDGAALIDRAREGGAPAAGEHANGGDAAANGNGDGGEGDGEVDEEGNGDGDGSARVFALVIDGKSLAFALEPELRAALLALAMQCASVVCCRVSPKQKALVRKKRGGGEKGGRTGEEGWGMGKMLALAMQCASVMCCCMSPKQKALVTRLVKDGTGRTTLGIGDGANDVGMIHEADIGVGISGVEGQQAVMASDFAIAQFKYLERLLLVHGHWSYKRIANAVTYFFYKNVAFGLTIFYYNAYAVFSGQIVYNSWACSLYNVFFTSLPVIGYGVLEQDLSDKQLLMFPALYQQGPKNVFFHWTTIAMWIGYGVFQSVLLFWTCLAAVLPQASLSSGKLFEMNGLSATLMTGVVVAVNFQIALITEHWTWITHLFIWGSIAVWYFFLGVYSYFGPDWSTDYYYIFSEVLAPSALYWLTGLLLLPVMAVLPYFVFRGVESRIAPPDQQIVQEIVQLKQDEEAAKAAVAPPLAPVGFTAAVEAVSKRLKKVEKKRRRRGEK
ncbi:unnamed protein product [Closterium sp. Naga37s-1]|nr:unnamed protein product [Closterium sp. Naga37s-1]